MRPLILIACILVAAGCGQDRPGAGNDPRYPGPTAAGVADYAKRDYMVVARVRHPLSDNTIFSDRGDLSRIREPIVASTVTVFLARDRLAEWQAKDVDAAVRTAMRRVTTRWAEDASISPLRFTHQQGFRDAYHEMLRAVDEAVAPGMGVGSVLAMRFTGEVIGEDTLSAERRAELVQAEGEALPTLRPHPSRPKLWIEVCRRLTPEEAKARLAALKGTESEAKDPVLCVFTEVFLTPNGVAAWQETPQRVATLRAIVAKRIDALVATKDAVIRIDRERQALVSAIRADIEAQLGSWVAAGGKDAPQGVKVSEMVRDASNLSQRERRLLSATP